MSLQPQFCMEPLSNYGQLHGIYMLANLGIYGQVIEQKLWFIFLLKLELQGYNLNNCGRESLGNITHKLSKHWFLLFRRSGFRRRSGARLKVAIAKRFWHETLSFKQLRQSVMQQINLPSFAKRLSRHFCLNRLFYGTIQYPLDYFSLYQLYAAFPRLQI